MAAGIRVGIGLDPGHVYAVSRHDDCDSIRRRPGVDARARRERRIFRKSAGRSAARDENPSSSFAATGSIAARLGSHLRARARWPAATMGSGASLRSFSTRVPQMPTPTSTRCGRCSANRSRGTSSTATTMVRPRQASLRSARSTNWKRPLPPSGFHPRTSIPTCTAPSIWSAPKTDLDRIARATLGVGLAELTGTFRR